MKLFYRIKELDEEKEDKNENKVTSKKIIKTLESILENKDMKSFSPHVGGISPKYFHLFSNKIIDGQKRVAKLNQESTF